VWFSLIGFIVFYTTLAIVDLFLIVRTIRLGPDVVGDDSGPDHPRAIAQPVQ
jgi:cytochrome bd-type quinol oxidase subunit 1